MRTDSLAAPSGEVWALVTGATSGIGAAYARELGRRGYRLVLTGRRAAELHEVADSIGRERVELHHTELSDPAQVTRLMDVCANRRIDVLVNNAGFGIGKPFLQADLGRELAMAEVHVVAAMRLIHALVPGMAARGRGFVVNVSSLASFFPLPRSATYSATKAFLRYFTETLSMELRDSGVRCQALCPGLTRTHFHAHLDMPDRVMSGRGPLRWMSAEQVVRASIRGLGRDTVVCVPGFWNRVLRRLGSAVPRGLYYAVIRR